MPIALFLDTMIYLHFRSVEEINWHDVIGVPPSEQIRIVAAAVTHS